MKILRKPIYLFVILLAVTSCSQHKDNRKKIFRYNDVNVLTSLDPVFAKNQSVMWPVHQLFNTLLEVNSQLQLMPSLAKSWAFSSDKKEINFYLRNDVFFHNDPCFRNGNGRKMIAKDFVYSFNRLMNPKTASPGSWIFNSKIDTIQPFVAINDTIFQIKLLKPFSPLLGVLTMPYCSVVPHEAVEKYGDKFRSHPVGTGPFKFVAWAEGQALVLEKNSHYFETDRLGKKLPYLDGIKVSYYNSKATEFLLFRQKKLDFINDIDASFKDEILTKKGQLKTKWKGKIQLNKSPYLNVEYFGIMMDSTNAILRNSPLKLKTIRQAINYGINRDKIMMYLRNSIGKPALGGFIPPGFSAYDSTQKIGYPFSPEKSKKLLAQAGFANGVGLPEITLYTISNYVDIANFVSKQLADYGLKLKIEVVQKSFLLDLTSNTRAAFFRASWIADYPDPENYLQVFYSKNPAPPNYTRFSAAAYDAIFEQALQEENMVIKNKLYHNADSILMSHAPIVPLWYDEAVHFVQPHIKGFKPNALNLLELRQAYFD